MLELQRILKESSDRNAKTKQLPKKKKNDKNIVCFLQEKDECLVYHLVPPVLSKCARHGGLVLANGREGQVCSLAGSRGDS